MDGFIDKSKGEVESEENMGGKHKVSTPGQGMRGKIEREREREI